MGIQVGDLVGDYRVTGILGRGGMGKVFRVRSLITEREEAMKVVLPDLDENAALADRFLREIQVHASLQHPNIAALHAASRVGGRLVMILELVDGPSLEDLLRGGPLQPADAIHYTAQTLAALQYAHEHGVIHRDIKPANILIAAGGIAKLTDFGIARDTGAARMTGAGLALGTLAYMAPEQIRFAQADARSDLYSLGLTCYEMVTGRRAMEGETEHALMNAQLESIPAAPVTVNATVPGALSAAIMKALEKDPARRFQSAAEFAAALAGGGAAATPPPSAISPADLAEVEAKLARAIGPIARRLVTEAARRYGTISEIRQALAREIDDGSARAAFLSAGTTAATFDTGSLDRLTQALAVHIGPIAKVVVSRAARSSRSLPELEEALAAEIADEQERRKFLAAVRRAT